MFSCRRVSRAQHREIKLAAAGKIQSLLRSFYCSFVLADVSQRPGECDEAVWKIRHGIEHVLKSLDGLGKAARMVIAPPERLQHTRRQWIEFARAQDLFDAFFEASFHDEMEGVPVMARRVVWIDLDRATVLTFCDGPVEVMANGCKAQRAVSLSRSGIELDCFGRILFGGCGRFCERSDTEDAEPVVVVGDSGVSERVVRIQLDRLFVTLERLRQAAFRVGVPVVASTEI